MGFECESLNGTVELTTHNLDQTTKHLSGGTSGYTCKYRLKPSPTFYSLPYAKSNYP